MVRRILFGFGIVVSAITVIVMIDIGCRIFDVYANDAKQAGINRAISAIGVVIGIYILKLFADDLDLLIVHDELEEVEIQPTRVKTYPMRPNSN